MKGPEYEDAEGDRLVLHESVVAPEPVDCESELIQPEQVHVQTVDIYESENWSDCPTDDVEAAKLHTLETDRCQSREPTSETFLKVAEVSRVTKREQQEQGEECEGEGGGRVVAAGHVAAMREMFESMTRAGTPCPPDPARPLSPLPERPG